MSAARKSIQKFMKDENNTLSLIMVVNETGFASKRDSLLGPVIPMLKKMNIDLPSDEDLEKSICDSLNLARSEISDKEMNWLINGEV